MSLKTPFCLMPFIHYHVTNAGYVKACCVSNINYGNCNTQSFNDIWNGESINKLRAKFKKGQSDSRCAVCLNIEKAGGKSIRQETHERFVLGEMSEDVGLPVYFDIRSSNACNFTCRTCWHGASSSWFPEAKKLNRHCNDIALIQNISNFKNFISQMGEALLQAEEIYFAGGEPLMSEEHYLLLKFLINQKHTKLRLRYNTNFSLLEYKGQNIVDYWEYFDNIEILASVDAHEKLGEYIRKGFSWSQFVKNRDIVRDFPNIKFKIAPTISLFSMANIPNLYKTCLNLNIIDKEGIYINILERPHYYNIKAFPFAIKSKIIKSFNQFYTWANLNDIPQSVLNQFQECVNYMKAEDLSKHWNKFISESSLLNDIRNEPSTFLEELIKLDK